MLDYHCHVVSIIELEICRDESEQRELYFKQFESFCFEYPTRLIVEISKVSDGTNAYTSFRLQILPNIRHNKNLGTENVEIFGDKVSKTSRQFQAVRKKNMI